MSNEDFVKDSARRVGFALCGIAEARALGIEAERLDEWIGSGYCGNMQFITNNRDKYANCLIDYPQARSLIVCAMPYKLDPTKPTEADEDIFEISQYAVRVDYHRVVVDMLEAMCESILERFPNGFLRCYSDTGHIMEKAFATRAGIGWQGRNSLIINQLYGSFMFLGVIVTDVDLVPDQVVPERCGDCHKCIDACPTGAISGGNMLNAPLCLSYWTTGKREHVGIPENVVNNIGKRIYGCDECQKVCPWNSPENLEREPRQDFLPGLRFISASDLESMTDVDFKLKHGQTAIAWLKLKTLKKNYLLMRSKNS